MDTAFPTTQEYLIIGNAVQDILSKGPLSDQEVAEQLHTTLLEAEFDSPTRIAFLTGFYAGNPRSFQSQQFEQLFEQFISSIS